ncbi:MAG TPA: ABC transporter substrate-binding protein [Nocardioidaceae bacterium]|nr:ABC transporter substrate-binding protein [Nocardioidaceae bacterium]
MPTATLTSRRSFLKGAVALGGLAAVPGLAACGSGASSSTTVSFGSNQSDPVPKKAYAAFVKDFEKKSGLSVSVNTVDHETFQNQINNYLQGTPDDVFTWFAGFRMNFFATKGLATPIDDVWKKIGGDFTPALKQSATADDGHQYFIPFDYYPWAVFYKKSLWQKNGYQVPKTFDEYIALAKQMQSDGLEPLGFADKQGWPAMGTFDILNMRLNGYDFHVSLMRGKESWTDKRVKNVFDTWRGTLPYHQQNALGRDWEESAQGMQQDKVGMMLIGMFIGQQFADNLDDLDFFAFPELDPSHGQDSLDAPTDGFMMSKSPRNEDGAKKFLTYLAGTRAEETYLKADASVIGANSNIDTSGYNSLQKKAVDLITSAKNTAQYMDRDTRPDFAQTVMIQALQTFIRNPKDVDGLTKQIEAQKQQIFGA